MRDNPMARVAHEVMVEAERAFRRADALAAGMEPHLLKRVNNSAIYGYTNDRPDRNVPPGDVLLAAALAAGISIDAKLGLIKQAGSIDELRAQIEEMRQEMTVLRAAVAVRDAAAASPESDPASAKAERAARRRELARRLPASPPPAGPPGGQSRSAGRRP